MSTLYLYATSAAASGNEFTLDAGTSRAFWCDPALGSNESVQLFIKNSTTGRFTTVGTLCSSGNQTGVVTAQGSSSSTFQARKSATDGNKGIYFD